MLRSTSAVLALAAATLLACAPPPQQVFVMPAPMPSPSPRVVEVLPPAAPLAGVTLAPQAVGDRAYGGGGAVLEHRNGMTRQLP